jgi:hypothetical protein
MERCQLYFPASVVARSIAIKKSFEANEIVTPDKSGRAMTKDYSSLVFLIIWV